MDIEKTVENMTLSQKADFLTGKNFWETLNFPELGVPSLFFSDGPHGLRKQVKAADHLGLNKSFPATCFPTAAAMANSWDMSLGEEVGKALGEEAAACNVNVLLGPATNMKRDPRCGRNFEYFSEDPYLAGKMAAAYVRGIQQNGTAACVKHFAGNNREERRMVTDSVIDERTLREIYLTAFEIAVKEGKTKAVMSSYNKVNGTHADENNHLIRGILRGEWGFDGIVVSDWGGTNNKVASTRAGSDLEMPACKYGADDLVKAVENGELDEKFIDESVKRILKLTESCSTGERGGEFDKDRHHALAKKCAAESIVLLKNNGILPLGNDKKVAIIGDFAKTPRYQGGAGSSKVNPTKLENVLENLDGINCIGYEKGFDRFGKEKYGLIRKAVKLAQKADVVVMFLGLDEITEAEGWDRKGIKIPQNQIELFKKVRVFSKKVVVVLSCGSAVETGFCRSADAIIYGCLSGQAGAAAIADVLTGKVNPSGKLAETFPKKIEDCPSAKYFHGIKTVEYREGPFIGYRYYDTANVPVAYPFGFGLSYTTFDYSDISADERGVTFKITNTGDYDGAEVAQLYIGKKDGKIFRPAKELKGFKKVFLKRGESATVTIPFDDKSFRYFDISTNKWETEGGEYEIYIGASSADIRLETSVIKKGTKYNCPYDISRLPSYYSGHIANVADEEFKELLQRDIPKSGYDFYKKNRIIIDENCTVADLRYSKGWIGRAFSGIIVALLAVVKAFGKRSNGAMLLQGALDQPVRALAKFGGMSRRKMEGLLLMFNGHFFKGLNRLLTKEKGKHTK